MSADRPPAPVAPGGAVTTLLQKQVRPVEGGVLIAAGGAEPSLAAIAPWWRPDPEIFTVAVRFQRQGMAFSVGDRRLSAAQLGDLLAARPEWGRRPVLLVADEMLAGWAVQLLADLLRVAVVAGPQDQGRWYALLPRRVDHSQRQVLPLGASYPFPPELLAGLRLAEPAQPDTQVDPGPVPPAGTRAAGAVLEPVASPFSDTLHRRLADWQRAAWRPGLFGVAVRRVPDDPIFPYRHDQARWTSWDLANAVWAIRDRWYGAELVLLVDGVPEEHITELRLLTNYLQAPVSSVDSLLWTGSDRVIVAAAGVRSGPGGSVTLAPVGPAGRWVTVEPGRSVPRPAVAEVPAPGDGGGVTSSRDESSTPLTLEEKLYGRRLTQSGAAPVPVVLSAPHPSAGPRPSTSAPPPPAAMAGSTNPGEDKFAKMVADDLPPRVPAQLVDELVAAFDAAGAQIRTACAEVPSDRQAVHSASLQEIIEEFNLVRPAAGHDGVDRRAFFRLLVAYQRLRLLLRRIQRPALALGAQAANPPAPGVRTAAPQQPPQPPAKDRLQDVLRGLV